MIPDFQNRHGVLMKRLISLVGVGTGWRGRVPVPQVTLGPDQPFFQAWLCGFGGLELCLICP